MPSSIVLGVSFTNLPKEVDYEELKSTIALCPGVKNSYALRLTQLGVITGPAFDMILVLQAAASMAVIADYLWRVYKRVVSSHSNKGTIKAEFHFVIHPSDGTIIEFCIGNTQVDKESFVKYFSNTVTSIQNNDDSKYWESKAIDITRSGGWVRLP